jgi:hypothetical protein
VTVEPLTLAPVSGDATRRPGEVVEVLATWDQWDVPRRLVVQLAWWTTGAGSSDAATVWEQEIKAHAAKGEERVAITMPEGPYSFNGALVSLHWKVQIDVDKQLSRSWEFVLTPDPEPIVLPRLPMSTPLLPEIDEV